MKKTFAILLFLMIIMTACSGNKSTTDGNKTPDPTHSDRAADIGIINKFTDYTALGKTPGDTKSYLDRLITGSNSKTADALTGKYLDYMAGFMDSGIEKYKI